MAPATALYYSYVERRPISEVPDQTKGKDEKAFPLALFSVALWSPFRDHFRSVFLCDFSRSTHILD